MSINLGEEITAVYLSYIKGCEFIQRNLYTPDVQGEIDVVGINLKSKTIYVCEVALHLATGLQYVKNGQPNNVKKLTEKFSKDIEYANKYFPDYVKHFMLWTPIVKRSREGSKHNQMRDIKDIEANISDKYSVGIEFIINERFAECLSELREFARRESKDLKSPVLRYIQVEEYLGKHIKNLSKSH